MRGNPGTCAHAAGGAGGAACVRACVPRPRGLRRRAPVWRSWGGCVRGARVRALAPACGDRGSVAADETMTRWGRPTAGVGQGHARRCPALRRGGASARARVPQIFESRRACAAATLRRACGRNGPPPGVSCTVNTYCARGCALGPHIGRASPRGHLPARRSALLGVPSGHREAQQARCAWVRVVAVLHTPLAAKPLAAPGPRVQRLDWGAYAVEEAAVARGRGGAPFS